jgi:penicillin-binding protein 1A
MCATMSKRNPPETNRLREKQTAHSQSRGPSALSVLLFWPFLLFRLLTRPLGRPIRFFARLFGYPMVAGLYLLLFLAVGYGFAARQYDLAKIHEMPERSIIHDRLGVEIGRIHGEKRLIVPLNQVSENFRKAILAREDERFYHHGAVDIIGIGRAVLKNLSGKKEGASTLTQQLASDIFKLKAGDNNDIFRQLNRKLLEIAIGFRLEASLSKDEILEAYINQINWGKSIKGIGEASRIYFEKHPSELTLSQSALLAGIVRGPDSFNPFKSMNAATRERNTTLERMVTAQIISRAEADAAKLEPIQVRPIGRRDTHESYAMGAISRDLDVILEKENIELGGLNITTTIDMRLQEIAEKSLDKRLRDIERHTGYNHQIRASWNALPQEKREEPDYIQGAAVVVENRTGAILAVAGGRDADESTFNRAIQARRQLGSVFKPFVYLAAFDAGLRPSSSISDGPLTPGEIKGAGTWKPHNSDGKFGGMEPVSYGLIHSRNTMSIRVGNYAGIDKVRQVALKAGFTTPMPESPVSFLGTWGASPLEVASAYSIFPNHGVRYRPFLISEIKDRDGNILYSTPPLSYQAANAGSSWAVSRILKEVATSGTAAAVTRLGFDKPCGGKTGTTNDFVDAWFAGFTSNLTCCVWCGFDKPKKTIQGGYGATLSLPIWVDIMKTADRLDYKAGDLNDKVKLVKMELCRLSGKRATEGCRDAGTAYIDEVPADIALPANDLCPIHPARAMAVDESVVPAAGERPLHAQPVIPLSPLKAEPVEENETDIAPPKALPVE